MGLTPELSFMILLISRRNIEAVGPRHEDRRDRVPDTDKVDQHAPSRHDIAEVPGLAQRVGFIDLFIGAQGIVSEIELVRGQQAD